METEKLICIERDSPAWKIAWDALAFKNKWLFGKSDMVALNEEYGEMWQYMGTVLKDAGVQHQFRHRMHPQSKKREIVHVEMDYERACIERLVPA